MPCEHRGEATESETEKGFIGDGDEKRHPKTLLQSTCKVKVVKRIVCFGVEEICS